MISIVDLLKWQGYPIAAAQKKLEEIQSFSRDEFAEWHQAKAWEAARFHYQNNALYRSLVGRHFPSRWEDLPVVRKKDLQCGMEQKLTGSLAKKDLHFGSTSGSSGTPLRFAKDKFCHSMTWALILDRYREVGISPHDYQARFYGIPLGFPHYHKERLKDYLMNRLRFLVFDLSDRQLDENIRRFSKEKFIYTYGYTNAQTFFARYLRGKNLLLKDICPSLQATIVTSEQCSDEDRALLERQFGVPVYNEYGASELEFLAMTDSRGVRRLSSETLVTEVLDESHQPMPEGESGSLVFTNIFNRAMPFIRYEVGDVGAVRQDPAHRCAELVQLSGRLNHLIFLPSGKKAAGFSLYYISKHLMASLNGLHEYQVRQVALDTFEVDLVLDGQLSAGDVKAVEESFGLYLEKGLNVLVRQVAKIDREKSGKLKHFISHLDKEPNS